MAYKVLQVGTGGFGTRWCEDFLPASIRDGLVEIAGAVDINPQVLKNAQTSLGLRDDQCFTDMEEAFDKIEADFCTIVIPPVFHEQVVDLALSHDMHILSEKPIAGTLLESVRIADKVKRAGKKMAVTMSHRFDQDKSTLRQELRSGRYGELDYIICNHTVDRRKYGSWLSPFRSEIPDVQMVEGGVHYLDILADLVGAKCTEIYAQTWNRPWSEYKGDPQSFTVMTFKNGARVFLEACAANAIELYPWKEESWRAECAAGTLRLDHRKLEAFDYDSTKTGRRLKPGEGRQIPLLDQPKWTHYWLIEKFVKWLDGGAPMETNVEDNLQSVALFSAAIESSRTEKPVRVQEYLAEARKEAEASC